jgi:hypothetical protein
MDRVISYLDFENIHVFDNASLDDAIVDIFEIDDEWYAIYNYDKMIDILLEDGCMTLDEAEEFINNASTEDGPVILFDIDE